MNRPLIIGTRGSKLALVQSEMVAAALREAHADHEVELRIITTKGDRVLDKALSAVGDKGLFVKELEIALEQGEVDLAVHSCKDLPSVLPDSLMLAAFPKRETPWDALVLRADVKSSSPDSPLAMLPHGACVGTSSLRRACQLRALRPDLDVRDVRGNVDTRLRKLDEGQYDAIVLAAAGLVRLGLQARISQTLPLDVMLPAVAQGILAIECRADDAETRRLLAALDDAPSRAAALAERAFLRRLEGGCQVPIAAYAEYRSEDSSLFLRGLVGATDGSAVIRGQREGDDPEALGTELADLLLEQGAAALIR